MDVRPIDPKTTPAAEVYVNESWPHVLVRPASAALRSNEILRVYNFTGGSLRVYIPAAGDQVVPIPINGSDLPVRINQPGVYAYAVYCEKQGAFAEGESSPKIIIKP